MSKELDYLDDKLKYGSLTLGTKTIIECIKEKIQCLEAIENSKASEALECLKDIYKNGVFISGYDALGKQHPTNISPATNKTISEQCNTIKQALLNAQDLETMAEEYDLQPAQIREALLVYRMMSSAGYSVYHIEKAQEQEKILQIIKEKCLDNTNLDIIPSFEEYDTYYFYLKKHCVPQDVPIIKEHKMLSEEEFYLLKRYFNEEKH